MVGDTISNIIISLKNAQRAKHETVTFAHTNMTLSVLEAIKKNGFVGDIQKTGKDLKKKLVVTLKYEEDGTPAITDVKRVSKQSRRMYQGYKDIKPVRNGYGRSILSTPQGVISDTEAIKSKIGGEVLFRIW